MRRPVVRNFSAPRTTSTVKRRLARWAGAVSTRGSHKRNRSAISFCTRGVAVAVSASTGGAQALAGGAEPQVGRSEIVAPLRDAVGLVHAQERRSSTLEA